VIPTGLLQVPAAAPGTDQIASHRLAALSAAVAGVFCDHYGRAPVGATTARRAFHQAMNHELLRSAERTLGRRVLSHRSSIHPESHVSIEIFLLADEATEP